MSLRLALMIEYCLVMNSKRCNFKYTSWHLYSVTTHLEYFVRTDSKYTARTHYTICCSLPENILSLTPTANLKFTNAKIHSLDSADIH